MTAGKDAYYDSLRHIGEDYQAYISDIVLLHTGRSLRTYSSEYMQRFSENGAGVEIKLDRLAHKTGNVYIETAERTNTRHDYVAGGVFRPGSHWLIIGDYLHAYQLRICPELRTAIEQAADDGRGRRITTTTSQGILVPVEVLTQLDCYYGDIITLAWDRIKTGQADPRLQGLLEWGAQTEQPRTTR